MDDIMKKYEGKVQFVMKNAPRGNLDESNTKYTAALWATAAGEQGKYFEMSHKMFDNFSELRKNSDLPIQLAAELGLDTEQLKIDYNSEKVRNLVAQEKAEFSSLRSQGMDRLGIPKFLINGKEPSARSVESWSALIDDLLKK